MMRKYQVRFGGEALEKFQATGNSLTSYPTARPVRGRLSRVIPSFSERGICRVLEGVIRGFYPIEEVAVAAVSVKSGDGEIPRQAVLRSAGGLTGRDGQKGGGFMPYKHERILSRGFGPTGSLNLGFRGEFSTGDSRNRSDQLRRPGEKPGGEKLNHERRESAWE
jgi:hypothetical protein